MILRSDFSSLMLSKITVQAFGSTAGYITLSRGCTKRGTSARWFHKTESSLVDKTRQNPQDQMFAMNLLPSQH